MALKEPIITTYRKEPKRHEREESSLDSRRWNEEAIPEKIYRPSNMSNPIILKIINEENNKKIEEQNFRRFLEMFLESTIQGHRSKEITNIEQTDIAVYGVRQEKILTQKNCIKKIQMKVVYENYNYLLLKFILTTYNDIEIHFLLRLKASKEILYTVTDIVPQGNYLLRYVYLKFYAVAKAVVQEMRIFLETGNVLPLITLSELD